LVADGKDTSRLGKFSLSKMGMVREDAPQEELAAYLHIRQGQLSKIERGIAAPSIEVLILLCDRFRKSVDWILRGEGN
jgi:transcriptional regulator with XRE-family HTH domain